MAADSLLQTRWEYRSFVEAGRHAAKSLDRDARPSLFDRFEWLEMLHRYCMPEQSSDILHAQDGNAQAWFFLADAGGRGRSAIANWYSFAFRPLFDGQPDYATQQRLMNHIAGTLTRRVAKLDLYPMIAEDGSVDLVTNALRARGWFATATVMGVNSIVDLKGRDFSAYWAGRPGRLRNLVQRKGPKSPFLFTIHHTITDALWADYLRIYGKSWKQSEPHYAFLKALAEQEGRAGALRLGFAHKEGLPVAAQFWTIENGVALIHKLAHDLDYDAQSPGTLLSHHMFRAAIDQDRVERIDYGTGDNAYKADWMEQRRPLYCVQAYNPRFPSAWPSAVRAWISRLVAHQIKG